MIYQYKVNANKYIGIRLDKYISLNLFHLSRSKIKFLINRNKVLVNGLNKDPDYKIILNDKIKIIEEIKNETYLKGENIKLDIIYEDEDLIVIDKPAGLVIHPGAGNQSGTLVNALINHCGKSFSFVGENQRPGIVHRIDKDTSGAIVVAKNDFTHNNLSKQFSNHTIKRTYEAIVWGALKPSSGKINENISRSVKNRQLMAVIKDKSKGKSAVTNYKTLKTFKNSNLPKISFIECKLETGRTHQIRVHLASRNNPLIGDPVYGGRPRLPAGASIELQAMLRTFSRQALHAQTLAFDHPATGQRCQFETPLPDDLVGLLAVLRTHDAHQSL